MKRSVEPTNILVFDLELNQPSEKIIEIGFVIGEIMSLEILHKRSILVNPSETLSQEIVDLTGISQDDVDQGVSLDDGYQIMHDAQTQFDALPILFQWGVGDAFLLRNQLSKGLEWPFGRRWVDIKALSQVDAVMNNMKVYGGLKKMAARKSLRIDSDKAHRADYDAEMTFKLLGELSTGFIHEKKLESFRTYRKNVNKKETADPEQENQ